MHPTMIRTRVLTALVAGAALAVAGCNSAATNATLISIDGVLAQVSCPAVASGSNSLANNVISLTVPDAATAQKDSQLAAQSATILESLCPALKGVAGLVIQASVNTGISGTPSATITTASLRGKSESAEKLEAPVCSVKSQSPYVYECKVVAAK